MRRDLIKEITSIKSRSEYNSRFEITNRILDIEIALNEALQYTGRHNEELFKYIPIATVASFEAFFRSVVKELIDFGNPYYKNVTKFNQSKNIKFDFDIINALQTKTVTIGEFISHILSFNNLEDINSNISILIGKDLIEELKIYKTENIFDFDNATSQVFVNNSDQIIKDIQRTFELRHIFCHEFATNIKIDIDEILRCFSNSKVFINQTDFFIWDLLNPNAPKNQAEMNFQAGERLKKVESELSDLVMDIKRILPKNLDNPSDISLFDDAMRAWENYKKIKAEADSINYSRGSIYYVMYTNSVIMTTKEKIESLKNEFAIDLKNIASR
jgi:hypothetical protein